MFSFAVFHPTAHAVLQQSHFTVKPRMIFLACLMLQTYHLPQEASAYAVKSISSMACVRFFYLYWIFSLTSSQILRRAERILFFKNLQPSIQCHTRACSLPEQLVNDITVYQVKEKKKQASRDLVALPQSHIQTRVSPRTWMLYTCVCLLFNGTATIFAC